MRQLIALVGLGLGLLCSLASAPAMAGDAELRTIVTNGGNDVGGKASIVYYLAGKHDRRAVAWSNSGGTVHLPEGTYDVHVAFGDGAASKEIWVDSQAFTGKMETTVEVAMPIAEARTVVTNGGTDVGGKANIEYYPAGKHDGRAVTWSNSGRTVRMPEGSYNVKVAFSDGAASKEIWIDDQKYLGKVEKSVEISVPVAEARTVVTNGGADVGGKATVTYFPAGKHEGPSVAWAASGGTARMPEGPYSVQVLFTDGLARKELWLDNQNFADRVTKIVELGIALARPTVTVTRNGVDLGNQASVAYVAPAGGAPAGQHAFGTVPSSQPAIVEAGSYDIRATLGAAEAWLRNTELTGQPHLTIELPAPQSAPPPITLAAPAATAEPIDPETDDVPQPAATARHPIRRRP